MNRPIRDPLDKYGVIVVDPPWPDPAAFDPRILDTIHALPVTQMAADNCTLWLWAPNQQLPAALNLFNAWRFTYKTIFTHVSGRQYAGGRQSRRIGRPVDGPIGATEHVLVATRGHPYFINHKNSAAFIGNSGRGFNRPLSFYILVEHHSPSIRRYAEFYGHGPLRGYWDRFDEHGQQLSRSHSPVTDAVAAAHDLDLTNK